MKLYKATLLDTADGKKKIRAVRVCHRRGVPGHSIRFIPAPGKMVHISSTLIRRIIDSNPLDRLQEKLQDIVLHPEMLIDFIRAFRTQKDCSLVSSQPFKSIPAPMHHYPPAFMCSIDEIQNCGACDSEY